MKKFSRLKKIAEFNKALTIDNKYLEIFKNPMTKEINECKQNGYIRGVILNNNDVYIWNGMVIHDDLKNYININEFRFDYDTGDWFFDGHRKYSMKEECELIVKYENILNKIFNLNNNISVVFCNDYGFRDFNGINSIKNYLDEDENNEKVS